MKPAAFELEIKERTSMDRILDDYLDFFKSLD